MACKFATVVAEGSAMQQGYTLHDMQIQGKSWGIMMRSLVADVERLSAVRLLRHHVDIPALLSAAAGVAFTSCWRPKQVVN